MVLICAVIHRANHDLAAICSGADTAAKSGSDRQACGLYGIHVLPIGSGQYNYGGIVGRSCVEHQDLAVGAVYISGKIIVQFWPL